MFDIEIAAVFVWRNGLEGGVGDGGIRGQRVAGIGQQNEATAAGQFGLPRVDSFQ